jgi:hypothetical protein
VIKEQTQKGSLFFFVLLLLFLIHTWVVFVGGGLNNFCPSWLQTTILPNSASQVAGITGMYHPTQSPK